LFQQTSTEYPEYIQDVASSYEHIRNTISGVLFAFKKPNGGFLDYKLEHYLVWNPNLVNQELSKKVCSEISQAIPTKAN